MQTRTQAGTRAALWGIGCNLGLMAAKLLVGIIAHSQGMIADGLNSAGDVFASLVTLLGARAAGKPGDTDHPFGHGKAEYIASLAIALSMLAVAFSGGFSAVSSLIHHHALHFSPWLIIVSLTTILTKLALYIYTRRCGKKYNSLLILANSEDHRNDTFITAGTLAGILGTLAGLWWLDGAVGLALSLWIAIGGIRILLASLRVLMDTSIDREIEQHLVEHILEIPQVCHIDSVSSMPVGARYIMIIKVSVPPEMTVAESHKIAGIIRAMLMDHNDQVADAVVHINPDAPHDSPVRAQRGESSS